MTKRQRNTKRSWFGKKSVQSLERTEENRKSAKRKEEAYQKVTQTKSSPREKKRGTEKLQGPKLKKKNLKRAPPAIWEQTSKRRGNRSHGGPGNYGEKGFSGNDTTGLRIKKI